jgi:radical SAM superfamily enzyme YgiQ (UPF0313 family)
VPTLILLKKLWEIEEQMLNIYICDLANELNEIDNKSIPIGAGYVAAYCAKRLGDNADIEIFRTLKPLREALSEGTKPDIVGFGSYDWNYNLTLLAARLVKKAYPDCLIVMGGANAPSFPEDAKDFLKKNTDIDLIVFGDGEYPFANIAELVVKHHGSDGIIDIVKNTPIDGVRALVDGDIVMGLSQDIVRDLSEIPSPYLTGMFDNILGNKQLMPILQHVRGCPYMCRFCVSGTQSGKVRHFPYERITAEIDYLKEHAGNRFIRLSDDNFGISPADVKVAKYLLESFETNNFPVGLKAYSAKRQTERSREVALILKPLMILCISFQTTTPLAMELAKRTSATLPEAKESLDFARRNNIATGTELIFGLPGETLESMKNVINSTMDYRFDSIAIGPLWLLRGSDFYRPEHRAEYQYRGRFLMGENAVTLDGDIVSVEADEIAVASKYFSYDDWKSFIRYQFVLVMSIYFGYSRELFCHALNEEIKLTDILDEILDNPNIYQAVPAAADQYVEKYTSMMFDSEEELLEYVRSNMDKWKSDPEALVSLSKHRMLYSFITDYLFDDPEHRFIIDIRDAINAILTRNGRTEAKPLTDLLLKLSLEMMVNPRIPFVDKQVFVSEYNIPAWIEDGYLSSLSSYTLDTPKSFTLQSLNAKTVKLAIDADNSTGRTDCFNFFRYLNSSLKRRIIVDQEKGDLAEATPHEPWRREERVSGGVSPSDEDLSNTGAILS